ncbi:MAG: PSD1 domain-containing protein [Acidobacteriia bacterium]|nr:PSD1 domain-containing protein [Terriglobia bacterium]
MIAGVVLQFIAKPAVTVDFTRDIQPVFEKSCYSCHGPKMQMGGLRLDARALAFSGGQSGKSIVPGQAAASLLYQRVAGIGELARMPMGLKPLDPAEVHLIEAWINQGAHWPEAALSQAAPSKKHWAFVAPVRPALPAVKNKSWPSNPVDQFVLARLEMESLRPSAQAGKLTLLRRLSLDLTGLPPTIQEVDAFLKDSSPKAYQKQVDRLLASPHYGERWARHWLDAARYADSDGFEKDKQRQVWFYRDWVINAFNRDLPYDRFLTEQLAGDLLPKATQDQRVATGFLRNSMINEEGGIDPEQFRMEAMFDRMDAIGKSMLGITIQCAQCHNHKYDPVTQEDYYRVFAFLNDAHESMAAVYTPPELQRRAQILQRINEIQQDLRHRTPDWPARMAAWETQARKNQPEWIVVKPEVDDISTGGQRYLPMEDSSLLAQGYAPTKHRVKLTVKTAVNNITGFRLELLNDPNLPLNGPGRSTQGIGALTEFEVESGETKVCILQASSDLNLPEAPLAPMFHDKTNKRRVTGPISYAIDGNDLTAWGTDAGPVLRNLPRQAVFQAAQPVSHAGGAVLHFYLSQKHGGWNSDDNQSCNLGRFRLSITTAKDPVADPLPAEVRQILSVPAPERSLAQTAAVFNYWRTTVPEWQAANDEIASLWKQHPEGSSQLVLNARRQTRMTTILSRGDFLKPGKEVNPGVPSFLHPLPPDASPDRLGFAKWLTARNSPTTARAFVNRVWQSYFGTGLVSTSEDLGRQSETPSHPALLDWLAVEFMERGWSMKALHRIIVNSSTYRQSSHLTPELLERDPNNRLLARGSRFRVDAEIVRDVALAASGLLNPAVGGPSVYPPAPDFLFQPPVSYGPKIWNEDKGQDRYRRALYTHRYRSVPYPMLQIFDAPNGDTSCVRRSRSNTPLQALTTLNEPLFVESAAALAKLTLAQGGPTDSARLTFAFRRCTARKPNQRESDVLLSFLAKQRERLGEDAAWKALSRVLLNLDETITKE